MKGKHLITMVTGFVLAVLLSCGVMGAMISGLNLPVESMENLRIAWCVAAAAGCILFSFRRGWIAALVLVCGGLIWLWPEESFFRPLCALISRLSWIYDSAYGWGTLEFAGVNWQELSLDLPLAVWGCLAAMMAAGTVVGGRGMILTVCLAMLPMASTAVVTNTVPDAACVFAVMLAMILLLLPATVRRHSTLQAAKLTLLAVLPVALALGGLFAAFPQDTYVNHSREQLNEVVSWFRSGIRFSTDRTGLIDQRPATPYASATANLSRVGPRNVWGYTVMEATADYSGAVYLRGQDFDAYDGVSWSAMEDRTEDFGDLPNYGNWVYDGKITIRTATPSNVLYLPYYPTQAQTLEGGRKENGENLREYTFGVRHPYRRDLVMFDAPADSGFNAARYTKLPASTRRWAVEYVNQTISPSGSIPERAAAIAGHVRSLVPYDTNTPRMSAAYSDFAQWFLEEAETGYCVHFASATAVLLRAAGIPARYVTGYMFEARQGRTVEVTADQAHAWVEYYHESVGAWVVLEATPADLREEETTPPATEPEATEPPARPTEPDAEDTTRPGAPVHGGDAETPAIDLTPLWNILKWAAWTAAAWLAVVTQYRLRRNLRRRGSPNVRVLRKWRDIEILCRLTKQEPPEELLELAQKAKFSQHTLTAEELHAFDIWLKAQQSQPRPFHRRLVCKYVLALW